MEENRQIPWAEFQIIFTHYTLKELEHDFPLMYIVAFFQRVQLNSEIKRAP